MPNLPLPVWIALGEQFTCLLCGKQMDGNEANEAEPVVQDDGSVMLMCRECFIPLPDDVKEKR